MKLLSKKENCVDNAIFNLPRHQTVNLYTGLVRIMIQNLTLNVAVV